ncbi:hypothetical protein [Sinorhizobium meliloti]|uniref:hypothetical protein n=1 Tax=Rhizobium meliloti TaxID=382 RepID=UPI0001E4C870|nr:hypothetical protein [Sinorhizobium meliloti]AEG56941.1 hypothetical protein Sinme_5334 [Sinorhizobium meliloti AK83]MDE4586506.1 hypothetical protein [Sinorhizobium meliloti]SEJ15482.1 hypothetical protein SAMN04244575_03280 [Sinorhizobium meliloti]
MRSPANRRAKAVVTVAAVLLTAVRAPGAFACGYEDPQSVSRGFLNWIYPDSLHVIGAISSAVAARRLPPANFEQARIDLFGRRYNATKMALEQFGEMLRTAAPSRSQPPVSLVLVEPLLWTRFERGDGGLHARVHVSGAEPGDLVLVSGESVISEIAKGRLTVSQAIRAGLMRTYGLEEGAIHRHLSAGGKHSPGGRMEPGKEPQAAQTPSPQPLDLQQDTTFAVETGGELVLHPGHH